MYQSSNRNGFLDILLDPMASGILASIALHAIIAASFPFLFQPDKPGKKAEPGSVKVVELTPSELQRIPQAPQPVAPQILPPVYQPKTPIPPATPSTAPPRTPKISLAPQTIPSSPIRNPAPKAAVKPPTTKEQKAKPQPQPAPPLFDPNETFQPTPVPTKTPDKNRIKPSPPLAKTPTKPVTPVTPIKPPKPIAQKPQSTPEVDPNNTEEPQTAPQPSLPSKTGQPSATPNPTGSPSSTPGNQPSSPQPSNNSGTAGGREFYGESAQTALQQLAKYQAKYPNLVVYPPKLLLIPYPLNTPCNTVKEPPFTALMGLFGKASIDPNSRINGNGTTLSDDVKIYNNKKNNVNTKIVNDYLSGKITDAVYLADRDRPASDKDKPVVYQFRTQLDPKTCSKK